VKRRQAIKNLGLGVTAGLALPWISSCSDDETGPEVQYDGVVGIIGAGAAGLAVADYLMAKGVQVKIFEASNRIGGRLVAIKKADPIYDQLAAENFPVELGADRFFGTDSEFGKMIKLLRSPVLDFRQPPVSAQDYYIINNQYKSLADIQADGTLNADFTTLLNFKNNFAGYSGGGSVADASPASTQLDGVLNSWLGNPYGSSADRIGAAGLGEALGMITHDQKELVLKNFPLANVLSYRYDRAVKKVHLNSAVTNIAYGASDVTLTVKNTEDNSVTTEVVNKLVITSSAAVLKDSSTMSFSPALPASKTSALSRIGMDASIRIVIEFTRNDIFGTNPGFIFGGTECPSYFFTGIGRSEKNRTLLLTINGSKAEQLSALSDDAKIQQILAEMDQMLGGPGNLASLNVRKNLEDNTTIIQKVMDWTKEPYIKGGQSYPLVGGTNEDRIALAESVNNILYFAGEATDITGEFGTISGAIKSGTRAAEEVIARIIEENTTQA
jgi:monoamine oxidase